MVLTANQPRPETVSKEATEPTGQHPKQRYPPALYDLIAAAMLKLEDLRFASLRGRPIEEMEATSGDFLELTCLLGALAGNERLCLAIAKLPQVPIAVLGLLAERESEEVRIAVASHSSTPPEALTVLAGSELTRIAVAGNPGAPVGVLIELAKHWDLGVRTRVVHNPSTPDVVRQKLRGPDVPTEAYLP